ncbi:MAG: hypothetical protein WBM66_07515 [Thiothrix litoralis]|jgi:hypothetical protein
MSEYQYYDFRAIDRSLTAEQKASVASLSSRAEVSQQRAEFVYHYGDFRGNVTQLMSDTFDMMLYVANWGTQRLMFRLPKALFNVSEVRDYFISDEIDHDQHGEYVIIDLHFNEEDAYSDWLEGEELLDEMLPLRDELLQGDFRVLYLAWLKAADTAADDETLEPAVPAGLGQLSHAQQQFAALFGVDEIMINVAADHSPPLQQTTFQPEAWVSQLPDAEKNDFLARLCRNEPNLTMHLNRRLQTLFQTSPQAGTSQPPSPRRRFVDIQTTYDARKEAADLEAQRQTAIKAEAKRQADAQKRQQYLDELKQRENRVWHEIDNLISEGNAKSYEQAARHLSDLRELAERDKTLEVFQPKLIALANQYSRRPAFMSRLRGKGLISP